MERRTVLQSAISILLGPWLSSVARASSQSNPSLRDDYTSNISIIHPQKAQSSITDEGLEAYQSSLSRAVLDFIHDHYSGKPMPVWKRPPQDVDLEKRISNIAYWVLHFVRRHEDIHFVDPSWMMALIMEESFFYEYALSSSFAAGICQFTMQTADGFGMVSPDTSEIDNSRLSQPKKAGALDRMRQLRERRSALKNAHKKLFYSKAELLEECIGAHARGESIDGAESMLNALREKESLDESVQTARKEYREFLRSNYEGKNIFNQRDLNFFLQFDERVTYKKPIDAMVKMFARYLRARNGNVLVATAGYNAGLSRTYYPYAVYEPYGRIPNYDQTISYVSKIVVNHHEIVQRLTG